MIIEEFIKRLNKVKRHGTAYVACCPAHDDRSPSMSVKEGTDGRILVHCFAGCSHDDIVSAMGLEQKDLFADSRLTSNGRAAYARQKRQDELRGTLAHESLILSMVRHKLEKGEALTPEDRERAEAAMQRVREIKREVA